MPATPEMKKGGQAPLSRPQMPKAQRPSFSIIFSTMLFGTSE